MERPFKHLAAQARLLLTLSAILASPLSASAQAAAPAPLAAVTQVFPPESSPFGASYAEWAANWWHWGLSSSTSTTGPLKDDNVNGVGGAQCAVGQGPGSGPVWYLAGNAGTKSCTIPHGRAILVNVLSAVYCAFNDDQPLATRSVGFVRSVLNGDALDETTGLSMTIDGKPVPLVRRFLASSVIFPLYSIPSAPDTFFGPVAATSFPFTCATDGFYVLVKPLSPGSHTIHYAGNHAPQLVTNVTYNLTVQ